MRKDLMVGISGIRGVVGESLTPELILKFSSAFGMLSKSGKVVLGRDTRISGEMVRSAVVSGLLSAGCRVVDLGVCATPTVEIAVTGLKAAGGVIITASHNPIEWNALKFVGADGVFLSEKEGRKLTRLIENDRIKHGRWNRLGELESDYSWTEKHIKKVLSLSCINVGKIKRRKFRVVLDCVNGAGCVISPHLLRALGCRVIELNCKPDGKFAHDPEPIPRNLTSLCRAVKKHKADLGFANDPDVDRLAIVSEKGVPLGEEATLALAAKLVLGRKPNSKAAANISTSRMIDDIAGEYGSKVYRTKVGEAHVARQLRRVNGVIGGEGNGGVILPEFHYGRDALVGMVLILQYLAESAEPISVLASELPRYFMVKKKARLTGNFERNLARLKRSFSRGRINPLDGIRIDFESSWLHIRKSNTEPLVRVIAEARSKGEAAKLITQGLEVLSG